MSEKKFIDFSYASHSAHFAEHKDGKLEDSWFNQKSVGNWRFNRMFDLIVPIIKGAKKQSWLTIGDGRFGLDAIKLKEIEPSLNVLPTDISPNLLKESLEKGYISHYSVENAEKLSFSDESFDYCFCKEAYHHFPRPMLALYEMLRVAKKGTIFIEPNDTFISLTISRFIYNIKQSVKKIIGLKSNHPETWSYETSGNYIYTISERDFEKVALGLNYPLIAFAYINDHYIPGVEFENVNENGVLFKKVRRKIWIEDLKCKLRLKKYSNIVAVIFKETPEQFILDELKLSGFKVISLPRNPYFK